MIIDVKAKAICQIDIDEDQAFEVLCKTLHMEFVLDEETVFFVKENAWGEKCVWYINENGQEQIYDDRGDLFVALRNVAVTLYPNIWFRGDDYIFCY